MSTETENYVSISDFCQALGTSRQFFYNNEEKIVSICDCVFQTSLEELGKGNLRALYTYFKENTRVKTNEVDFNKIASREKMSIKTALKIIGVSHVTLLNHITAKEFEELGLPLKKKVSSISLNSIEKVKKAFKKTFERKS